MRIGASARPQTSLRSPTSLRTWSGVSQLRRNRMNPNGFASRKKALSSAARVGPAHPKITAEKRGLLWTDNDAIHFLLLESGPHRVGGLLGQRPALAAELDSLAAPIHPLPLELHPAQATGSLPLPQLPFHPPPP